MVSGGRDPTRRAAEGEHLDLAIHADLGIMHDDQVGRVVQHRSPGIGTGEDWHSENRVVRLGLGDVEDRTLKARQRPHGSQPCSRSASNMTARHAMPFITRLLPGPAL